MKERNIYKRTILEKYKGGKYAGDLPLPPQADNPKERTLYYLLDLVETAVGWEDAIDRVSGARYQLIDAMKALEEASWELIARVEITGMKTISLWRTLNDGYIARQGEVEFRSENKAEAEHRFHEYLEYASAALKKKLEVRE
jgi:hypothetical protein